MTKGCRPRRKVDMPTEDDRTVPGFINLRWDLVRLRRDRGSRQRVEKMSRDDRTVPDFRTVLWEDLVE